MIIIENLNKMADYLDSESVGYFDMTNVVTCVLGHACRHIEHSNATQGASSRVFGVSYISAEGQFMFGSHWGTDPKAAAARLRYVAQHGAAPSRDQWDRFMFPPKAPSPKAETRELVTA